MASTHAMIDTNCILKQTPAGQTQAGADTTKGDLIAMSHVTTWRPTALYTRIGCCTFPLECATIVLNRITPRAKTAVNSLARVGQSPEKEATNHDN